MVYHPRDGARRAVAAVFAILTAGGVAFLWWFFVSTASGQRIDQFALDGAALSQSRLDLAARDALQLISVTFLIVVVAITGILAVLRRRWAHAIAVVVVVGGANVTTQILKDHVLTRPDLDVTWVMPNSLPSGHATVAASVVAAALLAVAPRWRWFVAGIGTIYMAGTGMATMVIGWHRPSDVVAAILVVTAWLLLALAVLRREDVGAPGGKMPSWARGADITTRALLGLGMAAAALVSFAAILNTRGAAEGTGPESFDLWVAYIGGVAGVLAASSLGALLALVLSAPRSRPRAV